MTVKIITTYVFDTGEGAPIVIGVEFDSHDAAYKYLDAMIGAPGSELQGNALFGYFVPVPGGKRMYIPVTKRSKPSETD